MNTPSIESGAISQRPLQGRCIGISISESDDLAAYGLSGPSVNALTVDLARRLIAFGATVALGHNWRTGGVMEAVAQFALAYKTQSAAPSQPLIRNYLAAPDEPSWSESDKRDLAGLVDVQTMGWNHQIADILHRVLEMGARAPSLLERFPTDPMPESERGLNLAALRFALAQACDVRLVIGGRCKGYQGLAPGIVEEAWWSIALGKKLVVCTGMGGAALAIAEPASKAAGDILNDAEHPLAAAYLHDLHAGIEHGRVTRVDSLSTEALLCALGS